MDLASVVGPLIGIAIVVLMFWVPAEILHKAGFPRWLALLIPFTGFLGLIVFSQVEWPIHRELAWLRLKSGQPRDEDFASVERYAVGLEKRGEWKRAAEVFEELASKVPAAQGPDYYRNCIKRLHERAGTAEIA